jgi:hypothetical protein
VSSPASNEGSGDAKVSGRTPGHWYWQFSGTAGQWTLYAEQPDGSVQFVRVGGPPGTALSPDMDLMARAPDMAARVEELEAQNEAMRRALIDLFDRHTELRGECAIDDLNGRCNAHMMLAPCPVGAARASIGRDMDLSALTRPTPERVS